MHCILFIAISVGGFLLCGCVVCVRACMRGRREGLVGVRLFPCMLPCECVFVCICTCMCSCNVISICV